MTREYFSEYKQACKAFAKDTESWGGFIDNKYYTSKSGSWEETSDNAHGGLDVSWAFHMSAEQIDKFCEGTFFGLVMERLDSIDYWEDLEHIIKCAKKDFGDDQ